MKTALDMALQQAANGAAQQVLEVYEALAVSELFLVLNTEPSDDQLDPCIFETSTGNFALAFDSDEKLSAQMPAATPYIAMAGRQLAAMLAGAETGLVLNPNIGEEGEFSAETLRWLADTVQNTVTTGYAPDLMHLHRPQDFPEALLEVLDRRLAAMQGVALCALLAKTENRAGEENFALCFLDAATDQQTGIAEAVAEQITLHAGAAFTLDIVFAEKGSSLADRFATVGLRFDLPQIEQTEPPAPFAPGSDPDMPPRLR